MKKMILATAVAAGLALSAPLVAAKSIEIASTYPKDMPFLGEGLKHFVKTLSEISDGELTGSIHGAGELVPPLEVLSAVSSGAVDAGYDWVGYWGGSIPVANLAGALPFGPTPELLAEWMWEGGGMEIIQKAYDAHNLKFLPCSFTPPEPAGWFRKDIESMDDLNGLRMRIGGLAGRALSKVGVTPQMIPGGEVYVSLDRGRIDAAEFSLPSIDETIQLQKAAQNYYFPGWHQPSSVNSVIINKKVWDGFSEAQQNQVVAACRSTVFWSLSNGVQDQIDALQRLEEQGVQIKRLPEDVLVGLRKAADEVVAEESAKDAIFKEAHESMQVHMDRSDRWQKLQQMN
ncbi:TRAP transporter substrate-binding protein [Paenalcaligenes niemegkensis]|uniref:TRAP transporter substrate-binding protein n=1 Tax=Paenalcaligenes niemegkensis TaxID=2895469 RepID=UPI001EE8E3AB|nr:TRAP transporter substrate-binding protein [Paenalcaligenes niemegkensis]MCQ9617918.1 TRAP transporter substrate-binding protein [Paenalcaligenes niemegkensis]